MSRKKLRYKDQEPKPQAEEAVKSEQPQEEPAEDKNIKRYKAVVRSPLGEWWQENKKRVRLFGLIGGGVLLVGWLLYELFNLIF